MKQTMLTSKQIKKLEENNHKIQEIRKLIGFMVKVGPGEPLYNGEEAELIGWRFNREGEIEYAIRLYSDDQCIMITEEKFQERGYVFIG